MSTKVLILGGYGTFGGRLAQLLADEPRLTLLIAGRSFRAAEAFCKALPSKATLIPMAMDRHDDLATPFKQSAPEIVVDATGPFQAYEGDPYRVVKACIALGIHYMDLADGADFVKGIGQFDHDAKSRGICVLSGVSSFPVLTAAVVRKLSEGLTVQEITGGIAPSPYAGVGLNVIRAVMSYAGKPIKLVRNGKEFMGYGLTESMRYTIGPPGYLPLNNLRFSLVDVPDLQLLPEVYPQLEAIWIGVAPVPEILHRMLNGLSWLVKKRVLSSLLPYASFIHQVINTLRWGEHRGGMFVSVKGIDGDHQIIERSWHLLAEGRDGPFIPSMAVEAMVRHLLDGKIPASGARSAIQALELSDYDALFQKRTINTGLRKMMPIQATLYQRLLGDAWETLPEPIRRMHSLRGESEGMMMASGRASVDRGTSLLSRIVAGIMGFPQSGEDIPLIVTFQAKNGTETWQRTFAGESFSSEQSEGQGSSDKLLCERFGPVSFEMGLVIQRDQLKLVVKRWRCLGIPLPLCLAPRSDAYEHVENGRFHFHVEIKHPLTGLIVRYRGWLVPDA